MQEAANIPVLLKSVLRYLVFGQMYVPLYKLDFVEKTVSLDSQPASADIVLLAGNLPSFAECKQLTSFSCRENLFTGIFLWPDVYPVIEITFLSYMHF